VAYVRNTYPPQGRINLNKHDSARRSSFPSSASIIRARVLYTSHYMFVDCTWRRFVFCVELHSTDMAASVFTVVGFMSAAAMSPWACAEGAGSSVWESGGPWRGKKGTGGGNGRGRRMGGVIFTTTHRLD
jgi:hypothetical protein